MYRDMSQGTPEAINNRSKYLHHYKVLFCLPQHIILYWNNVSE